MNRTEKVLRVAVADSLRATVEAAAAGAGAEIVGAPVLGNSRVRGRTLQIWRERRRGRGESEAEAEAALGDGSCRAVISALDRRADAVLASEADGRWQAAWELLEPKGTGPCTDVYVAGGLGRMVWAEATAEAAVAAQRASGGVVVPVVLVHFGVRREMTAGLARLAETMKARTGATVAWIYSPLCYREGRLDAERWWAALAPQLPKGEAVPVVCAPRLGREQLAAAWRASGGTWTGALRAGAEIAAARLAPGARAEDVAATLEGLRGLCS